MGLRRPLGKSGLGPVENQFVACSAEGSLRLGAHWPGMLLVVPVSDKFTDPRLRTQSRHGHGAADAGLPITSEALQEGLKTTDAGRRLEAYKYHAMIATVT